MAKHKDAQRPNLRWGMALLVVLLVLFSGYIFPSHANTAIRAVNNTVALGIPELPEESFRLGLDLQGGAHLVYQADVTNIDETEKAQAVDGVRDVIERRVNSIGVGEPNVQVAHVGEDYRIIVELPGVTDVNQAIQMIGETPILEFKTENNEPPRELTEEERVSMEEFNTAQRTKAAEAIAASQAGTAFADIVAEYSEDEQSKNNAGYLGFQGQSTLIPDMYAWALAAKEGDVTTAPIETEGGIAVLQKGLEQPGAETVEAKHILICFLGAEGCSQTRTKAEAEALAKSLFDQANAENFATLATENSDDPSAVANGGDLGSFSREQMVPAFADAAFAAEIGQIVGPVESSFGYHVIYKINQEQTVEHELWAVLLAKTSELQILGPETSWTNSPLSGKQLDRAEVVQDSNTGAVQVSLQFDSEGADLFATLTRENVGKPVAIFLDGLIVSQPTVQQEISGGQAVITGQFSTLEARELAQRLNTGALPTPVELISQQTVGASLGAVSLERSLQAGLIGLGLVMLFMLLYYRLPGLISIIALTIYVTGVLSVFKLIGVTLTLAGIAGFILSIGMAVDANVLIFERLKEELKDGKSLKVAVEEGFIRAWTSIRDGNLSTLLISFILMMMFQSSFVRGFAITLALGIGASMISAITFTRVMLRFVVPYFEERGHWLFLGRKNH
ncbi:MAG: protein translocase subunit SecD [Candidatus Magasanikbacteria bacterium]|jgi:protein-export membrane protein SecD|nr:protein translocase subunit SecD [Candidatus Magasanikbacteria bacterium]